MRGTDGEWPISGRRLQHVALAFAMAAVAGCASPRDRIESKLTEAGLPPPQARCVADRMARDLSLGQLKAISDAVEPGRYGKLTIGELAERVRKLDDPEIISVLTGAGINCVVLG